MEKGKFEFELLKSLETMTESHIDIRKSLAELNDKLETNIKETVISSQKIITLTEKIAEFKEDYQKNLNNTHQQIEIKKNEAVELAKERVLNKVWTSLVASMGALIMTFLTYFLHVKK